MHSTRKRYCGIAWVSTPFLPQVHYCSYHSFILLPTFDLFLPTAEHHRIESSLAQAYFYRDRSPLCGLGIKHVYLFQRYQEFQSNLRPIDWLHGHVLFRSSLRILLANAQG